MKLTFGKGNEKVGNKVYTFSLPAGHTCPGASECYSRADKATGKITDGKSCRFRCFAASMEARQPSIRKSRWRNLELLKSAQTVDSMADLIVASIPAKAEKVRVHVSGDFFSLDYMRAWYQVAARLPGILFYAYTKSLHHAEELEGRRPDNFVLTASMGGKFDSMILNTGYQYARVVYSEQEALNLALEIDHDDAHAQRNGGNFALLIHGTQPAGTIAAEALNKINAKKRSAKKRAA